MDDKQAKRLGTFMRKQREAKRLSARQLAEICGLPHTTITRIEEGAFAAPSPDKLARIAEALDLSLADIFALARYAVPGDLPSPGLYLRTKFRNLPARDLANISRDVEAVLRRLGIDPRSEPLTGEDGPPRERQRRTPSATPKAKGGKR